MDRIFKKRPNNFISLIHNEAKLTLEGLDALKIYLTSQDTAASALLDAKEKEADEAVES
jgi:hypothetical protein